MIPQMIALFILIGMPLAAKTPDDTLVIAQKLDDLISLDPAEVFEQSGLEYLQNSYNTLVRHEPDKKNPFIGELAKSWEVADNGKTITFTLREGVYFASGNPLQAGDVEYSFQRLVALDRSPSYLLKQFGITKENSKKTIRALNSNTVQLKLDQEYSLSLVLAVLSAQNCAIVDRKLLIQNEVKGDFANRWLKSRHAGSGPFTLVHLQPGSELRLKQNPTYFKGMPSIAKVVVRHVPESSTQRLLLEKHDIDIGRNLTPNDLQGATQIDLQAYPIANLQHLSMNVLNPALANEKVREAIRYLIDYKSLAKLKQGVLKLHQTFIPEGFLGTEETLLYTYSLAKAKKLLAQSGYENGLSLTLDTTDAELGAVIQAFLKQGNIDVKVLVGDSRQVLTKVRSRHFDLATCTWIPDFTDPHSNAYAYAYNPDNSSGSKEKTLAWRCGWQKEQANQWTIDAMREQDLEKRKKLYRQLQEIVQENSPYIHLFQQQQFVAKHQNAKNKKIAFLTPEDIIDYAPGL